MVSVVIPAYNEEHYIAACLDSLMRQTVAPDEIIVVDNNSTDKTARIAQKYPVRLVHEAQQGMIPARNRGFNEAKYEIIAQTDADTILPPDWIKKVKQAFTDKKLIAISGPADFYDIPDNGFLNKIIAKLIFLTFFVGFPLLVIKIPLKHDFLYGPNKALRKRAWEQIKNTVCLDGSKVHEDIDLSIHLAPLGKIKFDNHLIVHSSFRRWKKLWTYFEYSYRGVRSIEIHKKAALKNQGKQLMKKIIAKYSL